MRATPLAVGVHRKNMLMFRTFPGPNLLAMMSIRTTVGMVCVCAWRGEDKGAPRILLDSAPDFCPVLLSTT